jgi:hypothetical protein
VIALALFLAVAAAAPVHADDSAGPPVSARLHLKPAAPGVGLKPCGMLDLHCSPSSTPAPFQKAAAGRPQPVPAFEVRFGGKRRTDQSSVEVRAGTLLQQALFIAALITTFGL